MADADSISEENLKDAVAAGTIRCLNARREGMSVLRPHSKADEFGVSHHLALAELLGAKELISYYMELLLRADAFLEFFQGNVGESAEYPLQVVGESDEAVDEFYNQLGRLEAVVGVLTEI